MEPQFEELTRLLEEEVERQEMLLTLCRDQQRAIQSSDFEYVEAKALDIKMVNREGERIESVRQRLIESIAEGCGIPKDNASIPVLAERAPDPFGLRLQGCDERIRCIQREMAGVVLSGIGLLQRAADTIVETMAAFQGCLQIVAPPHEASPVQDQMLASWVLQGG